MFVCFPVQLFEGVKEYICDETMQETHGLFSLFSTDLGLEQFNGICANKIDVKILSSSLIIRSWTLTLKVPNIECFLTLGYRCLFFPPSTYIENLTSKWIS